MKNHIVILCVCSILGLGFTQSAVAGAPRNHCTWVTEDYHGQPHKICKWGGTADPLTCGQMTKNEQAAHGCSGTTQQGALPSGGDTRHRVCQQVYSEQFKEYTEKCHMEEGPGVNQHSVPPSQAAYQPPSPPAQSSQPDQNTTGLVNQGMSLWHTLTHK